MSRASLRRRRSLLGGGLLANPIAALKDLADGWFDARSITSHTADSLPDESTSGTANLFNGLGTGVDAEDATLAPHYGTDFAVFRHGRGAATSYYGGVVPITATTSMTIEYDFGPGGASQQPSTFSPGGVCVSAGYGMMMYFYADGRSRLWANGTDYNHISNAGSEPLWFGYRYVRATATTGVGSTIEARNTTGEAWTLVSTKADAGFTVVTGASCIARVGCVPYNVGSNVYFGQLYSMKLEEDGSTTYEFNPDRDIVADDTLWTDPNGTTWEATEQGDDDPDYRCRIATSPTMFLDGQRLTTDITPTVTGPSGTVTAVVSFIKDGGSSTDFLLASGTSGVLGLNLYLTGGDRVVGSLRDDANTGVLRTGSASLNDNVVHTVAVVVEEGVLRAWDDQDGFTSDLSTAALGTITHGPLRVGVAGGDNLGTTAQVLGFQYFPGEALDDTQLSDIHSSFV